MILENYHSRLLNQYCVHTSKLVPKISTFDKNAKGLMYISADADIPRVKLRSFLLNTDLKITTDITKANIVVIKSVKDFVNTWTDKGLHWLRLYNTYEVIERITNDKDTVNFLGSEFIERLTNYTFPKIGVNYQFYNNVASNILEPNYNSESLKIVKDPEIYETIVKEKTFCSSADVLNNITESSPEITYEQFLQLEKMFVSNDNDNIIIAMEIMANCNYTKSLPYLCILFINHGYKIADRPTKRHVNFKSLLDFMELEPSKIYMNINGAITRLHQNKVLTIDVLDMYRDIYLVNSYAHNHELNSSCLHITEAVLDLPEIREAIGKPYTFKIPLDDRED